MRLKIPLKMHRLLSLLAFVLALIGGVIVVVSALGGLGHPSISSLAINGLVFLFGLDAILGGWMIYTGIRKLGGIMTLFAGIILFVLTGGAGTSVLLVLAAGVLGLVAAELKPWGASWRKSPPGFRPTRVFFSYFTHYSFRGYLALAPSAARSRFLLASIFEAE